MSPRARDREGNLGTGLEREYKFLLSREQYLALWAKLREGARPWLQENTFFDHDGVLQGRRWVLRLRIEGSPTGEGSALDSCPALRTLATVPRRALLTLKGPSTIAAGAVERREEEAGIALEKAEEARRSKQLSLASIPSRLRSILARDLGGPSVPVGLPDKFEAFVSFVNLRLARRQGSPPHPLEVALDRSESADGRVRYELEVETTGGDDRAARVILDNLGTSAFQIATSGKFAWIMGMEE